MNLHLSLPLILAVLSNETGAFAPSRLVSRGGNVISSLASTASPTAEGDFRVTTTVPETKPLAQHTFAGQIEAAICEKYGEENVARVLESWRLMDRDYEHREFFGSDDVDPSTSNCYQYAHSYVPGLEVQPFWDVSKVQWAGKLAKSYKQIKREFMDVTKNLKQLKQEGNNIWAGALSEEAGGYGEGWSTLVLKDRGMWDEVNCNLFPKTAQAVEKSGIPATEVFFASMKPHSDIKLHSDFTNFVLTGHLAVSIPESGNNKCRLSIGDETREWIDGEVMMFDTSLMHDAINESDEMRYILMFRVWHPDLTEDEKGALQFIYDCLSLPELLDENPAIRQKAEASIQSMRKFPSLKSAAVSGFGGGGVAKTSKKKKKKGKR